MFVGNLALGKRGGVESLGASAVAPAITSAAPTGIAYGVGVNHPYTATGSTPITWSVTAGALPTGLSLNAGTGALTGTPTASGAFSWTVTATNTAGTADQAATATVTYLSKVKAIAGANLVALYSLIGASDPANDLSGNAYHGTISGATPAGGAAVPFPEGGNSMLFDGINDYVDLPLLVGNLSSAAGTMLIWVRKAAWAVSNRVLIRYAATSIAQGLVDIYIRSGVPNKFESQFYGGGAGGAQVTSSLSTTDWICLMVTWRETNKARLWLDGVSQGLTANPAGVWGTIANATIGAGAAGATPILADICMVMWADADLSASAVALATP